MRGGAGSRGGSCAPLRSQDRAAYRFRDLRDDGVSKGSQAVQSVGNPISSSVQSGLMRKRPISVFRKGLVEPPHSSKRPPPLPRQRAAYLPLWWRGHVILIGCREQWSECSPIKPQAGHG